MPDKPKRYTILGAGEHYRVEIDPKRYTGGGDLELPPIEEVRQRLLPKATGVLSAVKQLQPASRIAEAIIELRMGERFLAKSYHPSELLKETGLTLRGTGTWTALELQTPSPRAKKGIADSEPSEPGRSRSLFVSGSDANIASFVSILSRGGTKKAEADLGKLEDIRLPAREDRLTLVQGGENVLAVEIVLYDWTGGLLREALTKVTKLFKGAKIPDSDVRMKTYDRGPTFIAAVVPRAMVSELGDLNYLRSTRTLPRIGLSDAITRRALSVAVPVNAPNAGSLPEVAVFDGGYLTGNPILDPFVNATSLTPRKGHTTLLEHGTMVSSAVVYGSFDVNGAIPAPRCRVRNFRVLPDPQNDRFELYGVIDALESQVPHLGNNIHVINLSLGPECPMDESVVSRFTFALDRLTRTYRKLFVTAAGNWGEQAGKERVQPPADSVNNIAVGAFRLSSAGKPEYARYSSRGRGRGGGMVKPDVVGFGGCAARPFFSIVAPGQLAGHAGTSFAAPLISSLAGRLIGEVNSPSPLSPEALRALLINSAVRVEGSSSIEVGHGRVPDVLEDILECTPTRVSVLYQGTVSPRQGWKLPFLLPPEFKANGNVNFRWTIALSPDVAQSTPDEYTLAGIELGFRPHSDIFCFSPPKELRNQKSRELDVDAEWQVVEQLEAQGWKIGQLPVADSRPSGKNERALRAAEGKWEAVICDNRGKRAESISEPVLTIHGIGRGSWNRSDPSLKTQYAAVLTVDAPKYGGDLYAEVLKAFPRIGPMAIRDQGRVPRIS
jgi:hypothetical protein